MSIVVLLLWLNSCSSEINAEIRDSYWTKVKDVSPIAMEQIFNVNSAETLSCLISCNEVDNCNAVVIENGSDTCYGYSIETNTSLTFITITNSMDLFCQNDKCDAFGYTCPMWLNSCYKLHTKTATWMEAKQSCENESATLLIVDKMPKFQLLTELFTNGNGMPIWLGGNDIQMEGSFVWLNGQAVSELNTLWHPGDPNDTVGDQDCIGFFYTGLIDVQCSFMFYYVCQK